MFSQKTPTNNPNKNQAAEVVMPLLKTAFMYLPGDGTAFQIEEIFVNILFNAFINVMGNRTECTFDKFAVSLLLGETAPGIQGPVKDRYWFSGVGPEETTKLVRGRHTGRKERLRRWDLFSWEKRGQKGGLITV